jgi:starch-binding outer membrane protein, SusD/RagB family
MNKIIHLLTVMVIIGSIITITSCSEDFLTKEPPGSAAGSVMQSSEGVESLLIGTYSTLQGFGRFGGAMGTDWTYGSGASDDCYKGTSTGDQNNFNAVERYEVLPTNAYMAERWRDCYNGVARSNQVLTFLWAAQAGSKPVPAARAKALEGEAKFLRAWFHFKATRVFEKIPYVVTQDELPEGMVPEKIPNKSEGWDEIEADLQYAIDNLPESSPAGQPGRANKYSAMAVKAHAHLYQNEYALAKPLLDGIINSGKYSLVANYNDNFDMATENNKESIFEIQAGTSGSNHSALLLAGPVMHQAGPAGLGWGFYQPSQNLFEAFQVTEAGLPVLDVENRLPLAHDMGIPSSQDFTPTNYPLDPRVDWTISRRGIDFLGWGICEGMSWIRQQDNGGPYMTKKFMHSKENQPLNAYGKGFDNGQNFRAYRYGHVLLWRAEVAVEENDFEYARQLVNMIRERAKGSKVVMGKVSTTKFTGTPIVVDWTQPAANYKVEPYPPGSPAFASKEEARKAVRLEQRLEFATEGMRFFDLRRWGIAGEVLNKYIAQDLKFRNFLTGAVYNPTEDDYWPLPQAQLDLQDVLEQDPAYK